MTKVLTLNKISGISILLIIIVVGCFSERNKTNGSIDYEVVSADSIAKRCVILNQLLFIAHGGKTSTEVKEYLDSLKLWNVVTDDEKILFARDSLAQEDLNNLSWRREALHTLLWTLGEVESLPLPVEESDISTEVLKKLEESPKEWISIASIRNAKEIHLANNEIYEIHWTIRDAMLNEKPTPKNYNTSVVQERHYALNWVCKYEENWDDVSTDT